MGNGSRRVTGPSVTLGQNGDSWTGPSVTLGIIQDSWAGSYCLMGNGSLPCQEVHDDPVLEDAVTCSIIAAPVYYYECTSRWD